jgi:hypothetical protein
MGIGVSVGCGVSVGSGVSVGMSVGVLVGGGVSVGISVGVLLGRGVSVGMLVEVDLDVLSFVLSIGLSEDRSAGCTRKTSTSSMAVPEFVKVIFTNLAVTDPK